jgi:hypothetical protein
MSVKSLTSQLSSEHATYQELTKTYSSERSLLVEEKQNMESRIGELEQDYLIQVDLKGKP